MYIAVSCWDHYGVSKADCSCECLIENGVAYFGAICDGIDLVALEICGSFLISCAGAIGR